MENVRICVLSNEMQASLKARETLEKKLESEGCFITAEPDKDTDLIISIGGDGSTLDAIHRFGFPEAPIVGVNTGHLGFFQEIHPEELDQFIYNFKNGHYQTQELITVRAAVTCEDGKEAVHTGLNEVVIRGSHTYTSHFDISIGDSFIERFSGDGILIASPAGSTAYNYSLGGSIVDPRLRLLQVTPIAPMNTTAYRSFTSSILLPSDLSLGIVPDYRKDDKTYIITDGNETEYKRVSNIRIGFSDKVIKLIRFEGYDFWNKVKSKFL